MPEKSHTTINEFLEAGQNKSRGQISLENQLAELKHDILAFPAPLRDELGKLSDLLDQRLENVLDADGLAEAGDIFNALKTKWQSYK